jgi:hypothetical protein
MTLIGPSRLRNGAPEAYRVSPAAGHTSWMTPTSDVAGMRPTRLLPWRQLGLISAYWFGINAVWGAYEGFGQKQIELIVGRDSVGGVMGTLELVGAFVPILVVPVVGSLSDYTVSRFGKRKGYIIAGTVFDLVFIAGLALIALGQPPGWDGSALGTSSLLLLYALLFLGLQLSSNVAQGPYQGLCRTSWPSRKWAPPAVSWASCASSASSPASP